MKTQTEIINLLNQKIENSVKKNLDYYAQIFKKGGKVKFKTPLIKKSNVGKFTDYCNGKVTQSCIDKGKASKDKKIVKRAVFAENARKWKHMFGGKINTLEDLKNVIYKNK